MNKIKIIIKAINLIILAALIIISLILFWDSGINGDINNMIFYGVCFYG